ncbi:MAG: amidohydrolase family protein [Gammaproteobacteria bacterium]|nr:amidohydrolase family protein [Gammaproteobacteria bacterium]MBL4892704.1 amidohydrolase family protein [Rhizobiaceae bacterium]
MNIIDATGAEIQLSRDVLVVDIKIQSISNSGELEVPEDATIVDATDLYLIPGLWDMHAHAKDTEYLPLYIANGVTGTRQMAGEDIHYTWRERENSKEFIGPKSVIASPLLDGDSGAGQSSIVVTNEEEARNLVRQYYQKGADLIKVYSNLSRENYFAIADESNKLGIPFAGHVPNDVLFSEAADAGQSSIEHMLGIDLATSDTFTEFMETYRDKEQNSKDGIENQQLIYEGHNGDTASKLFASLASNGTWLTPTLTAHRSLVFIDERIEIEKEEFSYLPFDRFSAWNSLADQYRNTRSVDTVIMLERQYESYKKLVGDMHRAGVKIIAGTDSGQGYCVIGFCLHEELKLLVESGLSPMAALQSATINAAELSGKLQDFGTIEEGKRADLVLLQANPLDDIRNTKTISAVVLNGTLYDRNALDALLYEVKQLPANYR